MDPVTIGAIGFALLFTLIFLGLPIGFSFLNVGFLGTVYLAGTSSALSALARIPFTWISDYIFTTVPLFVLSGLLIAKSGVAKELFAVANIWLGRMPGGLAMATTGAIGIFGAISGSSAAGVATMSTVCYPEMKRYKYNDSLATGCIAAGGGIDLMIPPSLGLILFGIMTEVSIGKLFLAGIIPGLLQIGSFFLAIYLVVKFNPAAAPASDRNRATWMQKITALRDLWMVAALFILVLGGIYLGYFTPIEAGAVSSAGAFTFLLISRRLTFGILMESLRETVSITVLIFTLLLGAMVFNVFLTLSRLPAAMAEMLNSVGSPTAGVMLILALYLPLGMVLDATAMIVLTVPLFLPFLMGNEVDLIWFAIMLMMMIQIGLITPPVGMNVFIARAVIQTVPVKTIFVGMVPFLIADVIVLALLFLFPQVSVFLPNAMR